MFLVFDIGDYALDLVSGKLTENIGGIIRVELRDFFGNFFWRKLI